MTPRRRTLHFLHIGKTGGTAIKHALNIGSSNCEYTIQLHRHGFTLPDVPVGDGVIFFLRDPISRFVSGFYSRQRQGQPRGFWAWSPKERDAFERFRTANDLARCISSSDEEQRRMAYRAMKGIQHVRDSYWRWFEGEDYFRSRLSDIFFVGFQETLSDDFEALRAKLGLSDAARLPADDIQAHRNPEGLDTTLDEQAIANLKRWYESDYRFLGLCEKLLNVRSRKAHIAGSYPATPTAS
jgi:hypothetical protein